jgi:Xaa-Pro dipeptidase
MIDPQTYRLRQQRIFDTLSQRQIEAAVIVDLEGLRNQSLRYLCGQPGDALLFLFAGAESLLVPWDAPLARSLATADTLIPYEQFGWTCRQCSLIPWSGL